MKYFLLAFALLLPGAVFAQEFVPLTGLPGLSTITSAAESGSLPQFFNTLYKLCIGAAATIAVFNIMYAGFQAMTLEGSITEKGKIRSRITNSVFGLLLVLSPAIVFGIIDPRILNLDIANVDKLRLTHTPTSSGPVNNGIFHNGDQLYDASDEQRCAAQDSCSVVEEESGGQTIKSCRCENAAEEAEGHDPSRDISGRYLAVHPSAGSYLLVGSTIRRFENRAGCVWLWGGVYQNRNQCTAARTQLLNAGASEGLAADLFTYDCRVTEDREYGFADTCVDQPHFQGLAF